VWKKVEHATCSANGCSLKHILCGCNKAVTQNLRTRRHDSILLTIYQATREAANRGLARFKLTNGKVKKIKIVSFNSNQEASYKMMKQKVMSKRHPKAKRARSKPHAHSPQSSKEMMIGPWCLT
jgi:hypothetical protein